MDTLDEEERISEPEEFVPDEHVPGGWGEFAPAPEPAVERQIVRQPVVEVSSRRVYRQIDVRPGLTEKTVVEEELFAEPPGDVRFEEEYPEDADIWKEPVEEPEEEETVVTTRRQVFRRRVSEEPPALEEEETGEKVTVRLAVDEDKTTEPLAPPRRVERLFVRRILRKADGTETLLDKSESVVPVESEPGSEEEEPEPEEEPTRGVVVRRVIRRPLFLTSQRTVLRRVEIGKDGGETEIGDSVVESDEEVETTEPIVTHRTVKRVVGMVAEDDIDERVPLEIVRTDRPEGEEAEEEVAGEVKRLVRRRSITRRQRRVVRRVVERDDGSEEGVEDEIMLPVEAVGYRVVRRRIVKADKTEEVVAREEYDLPLTEETRETIEEVKDEESGKERKVIRRPLPVVTVRKVYRTIIITESGEELDSEENVEEQDVAEVIEEPREEVLPAIEEVRRVERREADIVVTRRQVYRSLTVKATDEIEVEEEAIPEPDGVALDVEVTPYDELPEEEVLVDAVDEESEDRLRRVVRRPVHVTSRRTVIRKLVAAGTEEHDGEVVEEEEEDRSATVYPRRVVVRRPVVQEEQVDTLDEEERISEPEEFVPDEHVPGGWGEFAPAPEPAVERQIVRQPVVEVSSRRVYRQIDVRPGLTEKTVVEEELFAEPPGDVRFEEEYPEDADIWKEPVEEPEEEETVVTTRRQVFRRRVSEEPPALEEEETGEKVTVRLAVDEDKTTEPLAPPRRVERLFVRRILRKADGTETLLDKSESVVPVESEPGSEEEEPEPEEEPTRGVVVRRVIRRPLFLTSQRTVLRRVEIGKDGGETEIGDSVVESDEEVETTEPIVTHRTVKRVVGMVAEDDIDERVPLEIVRTDRPEGEEAEEEVAGEVKRLVRRRSITRRQRRVVRRVVERDDGSEEGVEDEIMLPVEAVGYRVVRRRIVKADKTEEVVAREEYDLPLTEETRETIEEVKDEESGKERKVIRRPLPVVTVRKVYRTIIITESGEELDSEENVEEQDVAEVIEEPREEVLPAIEEVRRVERREADIVVTRRQVYRSLTVKATDEIEVEEEAIPEPDGVALDVEVTPYDELPEEEVLVDAVDEESEDRLRRVVRRPVHVTSRRTVIRKLVAAGTEEHDGEVVEEEEEDRSATVYPRRVVVRRPVVQEEQVDTLDEEERISEPEEFVPDEHVPGGWGEFAPAPEPAVERQIVRQPVVEVSSRRVYRQIDVRPGLTEKTVVEEELFAEPPGDVRFEEEYPEDADIWKEPVEEPEEEETVVTTRRQVFRRRVSEEPPALEEEETGEKVTVRLAVDEDKTTEPLAPPRRVERLFVRRILRKADGTETLLDKSESVVPVESEPGSEEEEPEPEEEPTRGVVVRRVIRRPLFLTSQRTVLRRVEIGKDGGETEIGDSVVESDEEVETTEPIVTHRTVKRVVGMVAEDDIDERVPLEIVRTDRPEGEEAEEEVAGEVKRLVRRRSITRRQRRVVRRVVERDDGSEEGVEDEIMLPVEAVGYRVVRRRIVKADKTEEVVAREEYDLPLTEETRETIEEVKDEESGKERKVIRRPLPVVTVRKVYRTIIITESGEELDSEENVEEQDVAEVIEEPREEVLPAIEEVRRVERREADIVVTRRQVYRSLTVKATDEIEVEEEAIPEPDGVALDVEVTPYDELPEEEVLVDAVDEESEDRLRRVVRRPVHVTSRRTVIRKLVAAGTEEHDGEVVEEEEEDRSATVYPRRVVVRRPVVQEEQVDTLDEEERISEPEEFVPDEHVPGGWGEFAPAPEPAVERQIVRQPVVEVSSRRVYRQIDVRPGLTEKTVVEEELFAEPPGDVRFEEEYPEDADIWKEPVEEPEEEETVVTTRRQVFRRRVSEEPPALEEEETGEKVTVRLAVDEDKTTEPLAPPRRVERLFVRRILRKADGTETLLDKSESVVPVESEPGSEEEEPEPEEEPTRGVVVRRVIRRPLFLTSQRTVLRRVEIGKDGGETEIGDSVVESDEEVETTEPIVTHRTVKRVVGMVAEDDIDERVPLEIVRTDRPEGEEAEEEVAGEVKRLVRRRSITRRQRRVVRRVVERDDGSEEGVEDEIMLPVEAVGYRVVRRRIVKADKTEEVVAREEYDLPLTEETRETIEEVKDEESGKERKVIRRPLPVVTVRKVYRTIIITESGEELDSEENVEEQDVAEVIEEPREEVLPAIEEVRRVERREADIVVTRRQVYRSLTVKATDEIEVEEEAIPEPDGVALDVEVTPYDELPEEEVLVDAVDEESEDRLRRVVRRPVHVTSRRTVIRKLVAAGTEEHDGEVVEEEEEDRSATVYPRRVVVRRPVVQEEQVDTLDEEERISEPEEFVPDEHVPGGWGEFAPAPEPAVERQIVRQPVVEVSSRRVYRQIDVRPGLTEKTVVEEELFAEPPGDVRFEEEYPEDADIWKEPVEEPEEEETVVTTRRQVFRRRVSEEPPALEEEETGEKVTVRLAVDEDKTTEPLAPPRRVERLFVRRILRKADGTETLLDKSESVVPVESEPGSEEEEPEPEEEPTRGVVVRRVIRRPLFLTSQRTVLRRVEIGKDGGETEIGDSVVESDEEVETTEPIVTHRTVKRVVGMVAEDDIDERVPLEIVRTDRPEGEEAEEEVAGEVKRLVRRRSITRRQRRVVRRVVERDDGSEEGVEDEIMLPVEAVGYRVVRRRIVKADKTEEVVAREEYDLPLTEETRETIEEVKDEESGKERKVIRRPLPVVTVRKVYRTIIITESGEELDSEENVEEQDVAEVIEEPREEVLPAIEEVRRVERREADIVVTRRQVYRSLTVKATDEIEVEEEAIPEPDGVALDVEVTPYDELPEEEVLVDAVDEESEDRLRRVVRRPVHVTSRRTVIRKLVAAGTEEHDGEVVEEEEEDRSATVYPRRVVVRRPVVQEEQVDTLDEEERISEPEEFVPDEHVPGGWGEFAPAPEPAVERQIVRQPVVEVSSRRVYRQIDVRPGLTEKTVVEEELFAEPPGDVRFEEEYPEDADIWKEPVEEPEEEETVVTTRRQVFRRRVSEEPPALEEEETGEKVTVRLAVDEDKTTEPLAPPRRVERLFVRRILRKADGTETLLDKSESVVPVESEPGSEEEEPEPEEEPTRGVVVRRVIRRPLFLTSQRTVLRRVEIGKDGGETEIGDSVVESDEEVETTEPIVTHRTVKRVVGMVAEDDIDERVPLEIVRTDRPEGEEAEEEVAGEVKRLVRRRSITRRQRRVVRRVVERDDGSEEGVEDEIMLPVEAVGYRVVRRRIVKADKTEEVVAREEYDLPLTEETRETIEEVKDEESGKERKVIRRPLPVVTVRKVYRTIIITESGEELDSEENVEEQDVAEVIEEPREEVLPAIEEVRRVERREADIVVTRRQVYRSLTVKATDEIEVEEEAIPEPDGVALDVEVTPYDELPEEEVLVDAVDEESEDRLRRVVRRPVHVTSRRTVIRKLVAAGTEEHDGEVVEEEEEDRSATVYPRRVVVRRPVVQEEQVDTLDEEERISEPEEFVPDEHVPGGWGEFAPAPEPAVERQIVRQPVVEVSSRRVYRQIDVRPGLTEKTVVEEELFAEPPGDVRFEEEYPEDADIWKEPVEEPEEEETVVTTRRQVFRRRVSEEPPALEEEETGEKVTVRLAVDEDKTTEPLAPPRRVERLFVRRILRKADGTETLLDKSESVVPVESEPGSEEEEPEPEEEPTRGVVVRRVIRRPLFLTSQRTVLRRVEIGKDGGETEIGDSVVESDEEVETTEPIVTHRTVKRVVGMVAEDDIDERVPLEIVRTDRPEGEEAEEEVAGEVKRLVRRRSITRRQRRVVRRVVERDDGSEEGVEDEIMLPVEAVGYRVVRRRIVKADKTEEVVAREEYDLPLTEETRETIEEVKDEESGKERKVIRRPLPVVTVRKVYRTIIITESGEELDSEENVEEQDVAEVIEEPREEVLPAIEEVRRVERREADIVVTRRQVYRSLTVKATDEIEVEEEAIPEPDGVALDVEVTPYDELPEEEVLVDAVDEESEDRLRRVVRRPVHVTSRRTVIRKLVAAGTEEHDGEVVEEEEEDRSATVYPRRVVVRRPVVQEEQVDTLDEEERISEPEEFVPDEHVPGGWGEFAPAPEPAVERQIVRQPVVEVSSRRVYRQIDVRPGLTEKTVVEEELFAEPPGDVRFEEEYPEDADIWKEPVEEPEEEETVVTTRRQVIRTVCPDLIYYRQGGNGVNYLPQYSGASSGDSSDESPSGDKVVTVIRPDDESAYDVTKRRVFREVVSTPISSEVLGPVESVPIPSVEVQHVPSDDYVYEEEDFRVPNVFGRVHHENVDVVSKRIVYRESDVAPEADDTVGTMEYADVTMEEFEKAKEWEEMTAPKRMKTFVYRKEVVTYKTVFVRKLVDEFGKIIDDSKEIDQLEQAGFKRQGDDDDLHGGMYFAHLLFVSVSFAFTICFSCWKVWMTVLALHHVLLL